MSLFVNVLMHYSCKWSIANVLMHPFGGKETLRCCPKVTSNLKTGLQVRFWSLCHSASPTKASVFDCAYYSTLCGYLVLKISAKVPSSVLIDVWLVSRQFCDKLNKKKQVSLTLAHDQIWRGFMLIYCQCVVSRLCTHQSMFKGRWNFGGNVSSITPAQIPSIQVVWPVYVDFHFTNVV